MLGALRLAERSAERIALSAALRAATKVDDDFQASKLMPTGSPNEPFGDQKMIQNRADVEMCDIESTLIFTCFGAPRVISLRASGPQGRLLFQLQKSTRFGTRF